MRAEFCALIDEADADDGRPRRDRHRGRSGVQRRRRLQGGRRGVRDGVAVAPWNEPWTTNPGAALRAATTPVVCAVNGACVTGALELALSCTFIVASERARFADTHARLGVVAAWGLTALLPQAVGVRKAAELSITGNFVDAAEALRLGLVNHVVRPRRAPAPSPGRWSTTSRPTAAVAQVLDLYRRGDGLPLEQALRLETEHAATQRVDPAAFGAAGAAAARRKS